MTSLVQLFERPQERKPEEILGACEQGLEEHCLEERGCMVQRDVEVAARGAEDPRGRLSRMVVGLLQHLQGSVRCLRASLASPPHGFALLGSSHKGHPSLL